MYEGQKFPRQIKYIYLNRNWYFSTVIIYKIHVLYPFMYFIYLVDSFIYAGTKHIMTAQHIVPNVVNNRGLVR